MRSFVWICCFVAACGQKPSPPSPGSGSSAAAPPGPSATQPAQPPPPPAGKPAARAAAPEEECDPQECGPPMRMPNRQCPDGSIAGPTDRCLRHPDGRCGWEIRRCP